MGLFKNAAQVLATVAVQESGITLPQMAPVTLVEEMRVCLESIPSLTEEEMVFEAVAVPITYSERLGKFLIEMEDLSRYMVTNNVTSLMEAISDIMSCNEGCEGRESEVGLVIDEESILSEMEELGFNISNTQCAPCVGGTIGDGITGALGSHLDIYKTRRFANSKQIIDQVRNQFGLPIYKKNYNIGLVINETANLKTTGKQVIQEKDPKADVLKGTDAPGTIARAALKEDVNERDAYLQKIRAIALGEFDEELY